jgi:hypothetical protein
VSGLVRTRRVKALRRGRKAKGAGQGALSNGSEKMRTAPWYGRWLRLANHAFENDRDAPQTIKMR